jgi:hypothetical protein
LLALTLSGCGDACRNQIIQQSASPNGRWLAVLIQRNCGATTDFSTQVSVVRNGEVPSGSGNVFRADTDHGKAGAESWAGPWAEVNWVADDLILIRYDRRSRTFATNRHIGGVRITYEQVAR